MLSASPANGVVVGAVAAPVQLSLNGPFDFKWNTASTTTEWFNNDSNDHGGGFTLTSLVNVTENPISCVCVNSDEDAAGANDYVELYSEPTTGTYSGIGTRVFVHRSGFFVNISNGLALQPARTYNDIAVYRPAGMNSPLVMAVGGNGTTATLTVAGRTVATGILTLNQIQGFDYATLSAAVPVGTFCVGWGFSDTPNSVGADANYMITKVGSSILCSAIDVSGTAWSAPRMTSGVPAWTTGRLIDLGSMPSTLTYDYLNSNIPTGRFGIGFSQYIGNGYPPEVGGIYLFYRGSGGYLVGEAISRTGNSYSVVIQSGQPITWSSSTTVLTLDNLDFSNVVSQLSGRSFAFVITPYDATGGPNPDYDSQGWCIYDGNSISFQLTTCEQGYGQVYSAQYTTGNPFWNVNSSGPNIPPNQTITHHTNIVDFDPSQIGTFAETTGELADVYGTGYKPTLSRACDAICRVKQSTALSARVLGIIVGADSFASHGDCLCTVVDAEYQLGDLLVPDSSGLCRKATEQECMYAAIHRVPLPRITTIFPQQEFVGAFL
jgi:hypothetical protein